MSARIALVTARAARGLDEDMPPMLAALDAAGASGEIVDWDDARVDWARFDAVLLRSAWDYAERAPEFLDWAERAARATLLLNPLPVVRWDIDKHYLRELAGRGLPVVPTTYAEPGSDAGAVLGAFLAGDACAELVVKPAIGAGSRATRRHARGARAAILAHVRSLLDEGRSVMLQPYFPSVDGEGETALVYIEGRFSHSIRKGPLLPPGAAATTGLFAAEEITPREGTADEHDAGARILAAIPGGAPLYARIDLIRDTAGAPRLLELELIEPSLFLAHAPGAAERFTAAVLARIK